MVLAIGFTILQSFVQVHFWEGAHAIIWAYLGIIGYVLGLFRDNGKEIVNYYNGL